jgi:hypothetical protein
LNEHVHLRPRELNADETEGAQRLDPIADKSNPELFVVEQSVDHDANHLL